MALSDDAQAVRSAAKTALAGYARLPFYATMFAAAGFPVQADGQVSDALIDAIVAMGDASAIAARLNDVVGMGLNELLLTHVALGDSVGERTRLIEFVGQL